MNKSIIVLSLLLIIVTCSCNKTDDNFGTKQTISFINKSNVQIDTITIHQYASELVFTNVSEEFYSNCKRTEYLGDVLYITIVSDSIKYSVTWECPSHYIDPTRKVLPNGEYHFAVMDVNETYQTGQIGLYEYYHHIAYCEE